MLREPHRDSPTWNSEPRLGWWNSPIQVTNLVRLGMSLGTWRRKLAPISKSDTASKSISMRSPCLCSTKPYPIRSKLSGTSTTTLYWPKEALQNSLVQRMTSALAISTTHATPLVLVVRVAMAASGASTSATLEWELVARFWAVTSGFVWSTNAAVWRARERKREKCLEVEKIKENETLRALFFFFLMGGLGWIWIYCFWVKLGSMSF